MVKKALFGCITATAVFVLSSSMTVKASAMKADVTSKLNSNVMEVEAVEDISKTTDDIVVAQDISVDENQPAQTNVEAADGEENDPKINDSDTEASADQTNDSNDDMTDQQNRDRGLDDDDDDNWDDDWDDDDDDDWDDDDDPIAADEELWSDVYLNSTYIRGAKTTTKSIKLKNIPKKTDPYKMKWSSSKKSVATVDQNGTISFLKAGEATITCTVTTTAGAKLSYDCDVEVTNPKFSAKKYVVAVSNYVDLDIIGTSATSYRLTSSNDEILRTYKYQPGVARGVKEGKVTVSAEVDGITISCTVIVSNPQVSSKLLLLNKGETANIKVTGASGIQKVTYTSNDTSVASVTSKGVVKAKKLGHTVVHVTVDNKNFTITISVGKPKAIQALKNARWALGSKYSQTLRMSKGYYDCSSLVWRSYVPTGIDFGVPRSASNAPTAAMEAYNMVQNKKHIAFRAISEDQLLPGDVIFIASGTINGRYKNITHVAMYIGNGYIIHATTSNGGYVQYGRYDYYRNTIVVIARPTM